MKSVKKREMAGSGNGYYKNEDVATIHNTLIFIFLCYLPRLAAPIIPASLPSVAVTIFVLLGFVLGY